MWISLYLRELVGVLQHTLNSDHVREANRNIELYVLYHIEISHMVIRKSLTRFKNLPNRGINIREASPHIQQLSCSI